MHGSFPEAGTETQVRRCATMNCHCQVGTGRRAEELPAPLAVTCASIKDDMPSTGQESTIHDVSSLRHLRRGFGMRE
jgi:hypothetical protein